MENKTWIAIVFVVMLTLTFIPTNSKSIQTQDGDLVVSTDTTYDSPSDGELGLVGAFGAPWSGTPYETLYVKTAGTVTLKSGCSFKNMDYLGFNNTAGSYNEVVIDALGGVVTFENITSINASRITILAGTLVVRNCTLGLYIIPTISYAIDTSSATSTSIIQIEDSLIGSYSGILLQPNSMLFATNSGIGQADWGVDSEVPAIISSIDCVPSSENTVISLSNCYLGAIDNYEGGDAQIDIMGIDLVVISNCSFEGGSSGAIEITESIDVSINGCTFQDYAGNYVNVDNTQDELIVSECTMDSPPDESMWVNDILAGILCSSETTGITPLPTAYSSLFNNTIDGLELGILISGISGTVYGNTITNITKLEGRTLAGGAIGALYSGSNIPSNLEDIEVTIFNNKIISANIGILMGANCECHYNVMNDVHNKIIVSPFPGNEWDDFDVNCSLNYLGTNDPTFVEIESPTEDELYDIADGEVNGDFIFIDSVNVTFEPYALSYSDVEDYTITTTVGWNLIYLRYPVASTETVGALFDKNNIEAVAFRNDDGTYEIIIDGFGENNTRLDDTLPLNGFYVFMGDVEVLTFEVEGINLVYEFEDGWNIWGQMICGFRLSTFVSYYGIESVAYRDTFGDYQIIIPHDPMTETEREEIDAIPRASGIYLYLSEGETIEVPSVIYDPETDEFIFPEEL